MSSNLKIVRYKIVRCFAISLLMSCAHARTEHLRHEWSSQTPQLASQSQFRVQDPRTSKGRGRGRGRGGGAGLVWRRRLASAGSGWGRGRGRGGGAGLVWRRRLARAGSEWGRGRGRGGRAGLVWTRRLARAGRRRGRCGSGRGSALGVRPWRRAGVVGVVDSVVGSP